ncbi:MAG: thiamine pyrophosphate-binding protein [Streptosporangiales bacterium]|nr:thiamine pyrophosphate-binding protein [Streptosporangiales bacterium]
MAAYDAARYGSDVMVDAMKTQGLRYVSLNPGSSFRGLHDSIVNYGGNGPEIIECPHEKVAVGLAHGYAKASGEAMGVILHNVVGLLHGAMGIYYAYLDRTPVMVFGGTGPMALERRRPNIDWIHTANVQGNAVRDYTKWDDQPATVRSVPETVARGHRIAMSEPRGPVYLCFDAGLQEDELSEPIPAVDPARHQVPSRIGPDPEALEQLAEMLVAAHRPVIIPGYAGRDPEAFGQLVELAELLGAGVIDTGIRLNFPNRHPLNVTGSDDALSDADLVLFLDVKDFGKPTQELDRVARTVKSRIPGDAKIVDLGFNDLEISSWSHDFAALHPADLQVTADSSVALPMLLERCTELERADPSRRPGREERRSVLAGRHAAVWEGWRRQAKEERDLSPVAPSRLAEEVWEVVREYDWVLTAGTASGWAPRTWDFDAAHRHPGASLGTATQISISLGVALAHKGSGRLVVDLQPDGDLMFDPGALWVAAHHKIPMLVVMFNNRAYYNDWEHQERIARHRGTPVDNAYLGMEIDGPAPDFANIARSFGWYGEGPIDDPEQVREAVRRAAEVVVSTGQPALVDVVCQHD